MSRQQQRLTPRRAGHVAAKGLVVRMVPGDVVDITINGRQARVAVREAVAGRCELVFQGARADVAFDISGVNA
ncbi:MAG: hypothetical protein AB8G96_14535 [Phycisphaerales bacterium]